MPMPTILLVLLGAVALLSVMSIPAYLSACRPRRGTTEWMRCIETPRFVPLRRRRLGAGDFAWALLAAIAGVGLRMLTLFLRVSTVLPDRTWSLSAQQVCNTFLPVAVFVGGLYLLLRSLHGDVLASLCVSVCAAVLQQAALRHTLKCAALLVWALLFLWLWVSGAERKRIFPDALWLLLSLGCYSLSLLLYMRLLWLAPLWVAAWVYVQVQRRSVGKTVASALLTGALCVLCACGITALWYLYQFRATEGLAVLKTGEFYRALPAVLWEKLRLLWVPFKVRGTVQRADALIFLAGGAAAVCLLHAIVRRRDSLAVALLVTAACFALPWLFGGMYLLTLPLVLLLGRLWSIWRRRACTAFVLLSAAVLLVADGILILL